jgi:hypothetical protein
LIFQIIVCFASAIITIEILRMVIPVTDSWSDRKHFTAVAILWIILFILSTTGALLLRR